MNGVWTITFVNHLHLWVTKFKPLFMFFKLSVLTSNNVIWVNFSAILFDETQHVVKTSTAAYVPVTRSTISLLSLKIFCWCFSFVNSRACIWLFFSSMACWCFSFIFLWAAIESVGTTHCSSASWSLLLLVFNLKITAHTYLPHWYIGVIFVNPWAN